MTDLLDLQPGDKVLEIGTGSGYQAAILSPLAERVYSIEIVPELGDERRKSLLERLGYSERRDQGGRRLLRLAGGGAVRRHRGHRRREPHSAAAYRAAQARRSHGDPDRRSLFAAQQLMLVEKLADGRHHDAPAPAGAFVPFTRAETEVSRATLLARRRDLGRHPRLRSAADAALLDRLAGTTSPT